MIFEDQFIFFPSREGSGETDFAKEDIFFKAADGTALHGWFVPSDARGAVLWFHGNAGNLTHRADLIREVRRFASILIFDYRGYGKSEGRPSEPGIYLDARAAYDQLVRRVEPSRVVLFGKSLGGAPAIRLASEIECAGLIVQSAFTSVGDMAPPLLRRLLRSEFPNLATISKVRVPKLFIHSPADEVVPYWMGRKLFEAAADPKEFYEVPHAGHNDTFHVGGQVYLDRLRSFLDRAVK